MAIKKMDDDEIMDIAFNKLFGDLDGIRSGGMFKEEGDGLGASQEIPENAGKPGMEGISITVKPMMAAAQEGAKEEPDEDDEEDKLKGIGAMSPLMAQLHGKR